MIKQISNKQSRINRELNRIKMRLVDESDRCRYCGSQGHDLAHILPKSVYPEHYTKEWNLTLLCRRCHNRFDNDVNFRKSSGIGDVVKKYDKLAYNRRFK